MTIYGLMKDKTIEEIEVEFEGKGYGDFKKAVELMENFSSREELVDSLRLRCNELGKMAFDGNALVDEEELEEVEQHK